MVRRFNRIVSWFTSVSRAVDQHDGRDVIKVGVKPDEPSPEQQAGRDRNLVRMTSATEYLSKRGKLALTCPEFKYVPAEHTDIRVTMRNYILETMPEAVNTYKFLFPEQQ